MPTGTRIAVLKIAPCLASAAVPAQGPALRAAGTGDSGAGRAVLKIAPWPWLQTLQIAFYVEGRR